MLLDDAYADRTEGHFHEEVLALHRQVRLWPRALGTPPWEVARLAPGRHVVRLARWGREAAWERVVRGVRGGRPVPLFVGSRLLPRHVVLAVAVVGKETLRVYDPARGTLRSVPRADFTAARLSLSRWNVSWFTVVPR